MIRSFVSKEQDDWDQHLCRLTAAYRATPHESTGLSPNMMMLGREVRLPGDILTQVPTESSPGHFCGELRNTLFKAHETARQHLKRAATKQTSNFDTKTSSQPYNPGALVWYVNENRKVGFSPKLQPLFVGPALILKKMSELDYKIQLHHRGPTKIVHYNKLKPYDGSETLSWAKSALRAQ
jgi:hypothetical protein